jgi:hypothetical protein
MKYYEQKLRVRTVSAHGRLVTDFWRRRPEKYCPGINRRRNGPEITMPRCFRSELAAVASRWLWSNLQLHSISTRMLTHKYHICTLYISLPNTDDELVSAAHLLPLSLPTTILKIYVALIPEYHAKPAPAIEDSRCCSK